MHLDGFAHTDPGVLSDAEISRVQFSSDDPSLLQVWFSLCFALAGGAAPPIPTQPTTGFTAPFPSRPCTHLIAFPDPERESGHRAPF